MVQAYEWSEELYQKFMESEVISVDIETNTKPPHNGWNKKYGLSYVAPITVIALSNGKDTAVLVNSSPEKEKENGEIIRNLFTRDTPLRIIAHNASFDLRSLGGHYGFELPPHVEVWDTYVMAIRFLLGEPGGGADVDGHSMGTSLEDQFIRLVKNNDLVQAYYEPVRLELKYDSTGMVVTTSFPSVFAFLEHMKDNRKNLSNYTETALRFYVGLDAISCFTLYQAQKELLETCAEEGLNYVISKHDVLRIPQWPELTKAMHGDDYSLLEWEMKISRWSANAGIRGIKLDKKYATEQYTEWVRKRHHALEDCLTAPDVVSSSPLFPDRDFREVILQLVWFEHLLAYGCNKVKNYKNYWINENWDRPEWVVGDERIENLLVGSGMNPTLAEFLNNIGSSALAPRVMKEQLEFVAEAFPDADEEFMVNTIIAQCLDVTEFQGQVINQWFSYLAGQRYKLKPEDYLSKIYWPPYYLFGQCGLEPPTDEDIFYHPDLVSDRIDGQSKYRRADSIEGFEGIEEESIEKNGFSSSKDAVEFYLERSMKEENIESVDAIEQGHDSWRILRFKDYLTYSGYIQRALEFFHHSERDGRVHSQLARNTSTGRFTSSNMNLQNIMMEVFKGWLVGDDGCILVELDLPNAENKVAAMVASDDIFATATETGDFHFNMAKNAYFVEEMSRAISNDDVETIHKLRRDGKPISFGTAYGMGSLKLARTIKRTVEEAQEFLDRKDKAFPMVTKYKDRCSRAVKERLRAGQPPYVNLWDRSRLLLDRYRMEESLDAQKRLGAMYNVVDGKYRVAIAPYVAFNRVIQGTVASIISRSAVIADDWLQEEGYQSRIVTNVHDSLIVNCKVDEYHQIIPKICEIMATIIPQRFLQRTIPTIHIPPATGPENAFKWGYRGKGEAYPIPMDEFVNMWGVHKFDGKYLDENPEEKREAPVWLGPVHEGWTLEKEMDFRKGLQKGKNDV